MIQIHFLHGMNNIKMLLKIWIRKIYILLLGGGGVGKTYMIKKLNEQYNIINTASTGVASVNIEGCTIHQLFKLNHKKECLIKFSNEKKMFCQMNYLKNVILLWLMKFLW